MITSYKKGIPTFLQEFFHTIRKIMCSLDYSPGVFLGVTSRPETSGLIYMNMWDPEAISSLKRVAGQER